MPRRARIRHAGVPQHAISGSVPICFFRRPITLTIILFIFLYNNYLLSALVVLLIILINSVVSVVSLIISAIKKRGQPLLLKLVAQTVFTIVFPALTIALIFPNLWAIDFACTSAVVRIAEPILMQQIEKSPNRFFKFSRFNFGQIMGHGRWVVYDESEQVLLVPEKRSQDWWLTTGLDKEFEDCYEEKARRIYSHFFIRYNVCI